MPKTIKKKPAFKAAQSKKRLAQLAVVGLVMLLGIGFLIRSYAATGTATLSLSPTTVSATLNTNFTVTIIENSNTVPVNAVQADLSYDASQLQYVSTNTSTSPFSLVASSTGGSGKVSIGSASSTPQTGAQTVATVTFKAIGSNNSTISFLNSSGIAQASDSTNVLGSTISTTSVMFPATPPPAPKDTTAPSVPGAPTMSSNTSSTITLAWPAASDDVGVTGYKLYRNGAQVGTTANTSYTVSGLRANTSYKFTVSAYDAAGNNSVQSPASNLTTLAKTKGHH